MKAVNQLLEERNRNIETMFRTTAVAMILSEITGILAALIDGIVTSRLAWMSTPESPC